MKACCIRWVQGDGFKGSSGLAFSNVLDRARWERSGRQLLQGTPLSENSRGGARGWSCGEERALQNPTTETPKTTIKNPETLNPWALHLQSRLGYTIHHSAPISAREGLGSFRLGSETLERECLVRDVGFWAGGFGVPAGTAFRAERVRGSASVFWG